MSWADQAACRGTDVDFFPTRQPGSRVGRERYERTAAPAKAICQGCPVKEPCLMEALTVYAQSDDGIWGGTSPMERSEMRRVRKVTPIAGYVRAMERLR